MKTDSMGGHSHFNPFAEKYRAKNKKVNAGSKTRALDNMKKDKSMKGYMLNEAYQEHTKEGGIKYKSSNKSHFSN